MKSTKPGLGIGIGLRTAHFSELLDRAPRIDWFEAISENFMTGGGRPRYVLEHVRRDFPVVLHGVSMSIGAADPLDTQYLDDLARLADRVDPPWVSDHLCWTGNGGHNLHDLLPLPWTEEALAHVIERVRRVQDHLGRQIALENVSSYLAYEHSTLSEAEFLREVAAEADSLILLDVNNVYVSAYNHGFEATQFIDTMPAERVIQLHLAGHSDLGTHLLDTHDDHVCSAVWDLYRYTLNSLGAVSTLIEWDGDVPELGVLEQEVDHARSIWAETGQPKTTAKGSPHGFASGTV